MKIVVYAIPYEISNETIKLNQLFDLGLEEFHLRKPGYSRKQIEEYILSVDKRHHNKIVLHQYFSLAKKYHLKGIHVSPKYFSGLFGKLRKNIFFSSTSLKFSSTVTELKDLTALDGQFDEIHLGPLFRKFSEQNILETFEAFKLKSTLAKIETRVLGMGGVCLKSIKKLNNLGLEGVVLQSSIWKSEDIVNAYSSFALQYSSQPQFETDMKIA